MRRLVVGSIVLLAIVGSSLGAGAAPTPSATVTPASALVNGQKVIVKWRGFTKAATDVLECASPLPLHGSATLEQDCNLMSDVYAPKGSIAVHVTTGYIDARQTVTCGTSADDANCYITLAAIRKSPTVPGYSYIAKVANVPISFVASG